MCYIVSSGNFTCVIAVLMEVNFLSHLFYVPLLGNKPLSTILISILYKIGNDGNGWDDGCVMGHARVTETLKQFYYTI